MTAKDDANSSSHHLTSSPLGSDMIRAKLRSALMDHFHSRGPVSIQGYHRWTASLSAQSQQSIKLLVGDPIALAVSHAPIPELSIHPN